MSLLHMYLYLPPSPCLPMLSPRGALFRLRVSTHQCLQVPLLAAQMSTPPGRRGCARPMQFTERQPYSWWWPCVFFESFFRFWFPVAVVTIVFFVVVTFTIAHPFKERLALNTATASLTIENVNTHCDARKTSRKAAMTAIPVYVYSMMIRKL